MEIPGAVSIENRLAAQAAETQTEHGELGRDAFMQLLVNQLANQNPLEPMKDQEFVAQLATFSSLEQLESMNETMQASLLMDTSVNNTLATTLIGKEVLAEGSTVTLSETGEVPFRLELGAEADVTVVIRDADGNQIRRMELGHRSAGDQTLDWDGEDDNGVRVDPGQYEIEITAKGEDDVAVPYSLKVHATVDGVQFIDGIGFLKVGDATLPLASVVEIYGSSTS